MRTRVVSATGPCEAWAIRSPERDARATATASPFSVNLTPIKWGVHRLQAKVFYNTGKTATVSPEISFTYKRTM